MTLMRPSMSFGAFVGGLRDRSVVRTQSNEGPADEPLASRATLRVKHTADFAQAYEQP